MHSYQKFFKNFALIGLSIYFTHLPVTAIAGSRSKIIDNTPKEPSVCRLDPNDKLLWSKPIKVIGIQGDTANVVLDQNYTDPVDALFGNSQRRLFFSIWSNSGIIFNRYSERNKKWIAENSAYGEEFFVVVDGKEFKVEAQKAYYQCIYGNSKQTWVNGIDPLILLFSQDAKSALLATSEKSKILLRWYKQNGNKIHLTEVDIGKNTIESWKSIVQLSPVEETKKVFSPVEDRQKLEEVKQKRDCTATVSQSQKFIETGRNIEVKIRSENMSENYPDHPTNRSYSYIIILEGVASDSIMNSPKFMKIIAENIINSCESVGAVTFAVNQSGWSYSIGVMSDGKIDFFECLEADGINRNLKWGQEYCSL